MKVRAINNTSFTSTKTTTLKDLWRLSHDSKFTNIKPIKTYAQYLKVYGLDLKSRKIK
jgi:hypothetical protein